MSIVLGNTMTGIITEIVFTEQLGARDNESVFSWIISFIFIIQYNE
jgi:hypothetical protein